MEQVNPNGSVYFTSRMTRIYEILKSNISRFDEFCTDLECKDADCIKSRETFLSEMADKIDRVC